MRTMKPKIPDQSGLWDYYFRVKIPYFQSRPIEDIKRYGVRISGIEAIDRTMDKEMIITELNIDSMFEKWRRGITIRVINYNDTAKIYNLIHSHLVRWAEYLTTGVNIGNAPLKDLIELDKFASVVYDKAVSVFSEQERNTAVATNFLNVQTINFRNILKREYNRQETSLDTNGDGTVKIRPNETAKLPERPSMKDVFNEQINRISVWKEMNQ